MDDAVEIFKDLLKKADKGVEELSEWHEMVGEIIGTANSAIDTVEKGLELFDEEKLQKACENIEDKFLLQEVLQRSKKRYFVFWVILVFGTAVCWFVL